MPFTAQTFMGAVVRSFTSSIGWNLGSTSQVAIQLVDDEVNDAIFDPPAIGTPCFFDFHGFYFYGIFQKYETRRGSDGNPLYEVILTDPREILEGAKVILGAYSGSVGGVPNLLNAYGFWESFGFGLSQVNEGGMPWYKIQGAVETLVNTPLYNLYGGPLTFRGYSYGLDLSELPIPPSYYRIGGVSANLLELIAQICEDGGHDFFVELNGYTIKIRTASRVNQPPLGTISSIANSHLGGLLVRSSSGLELRNELTSAFLIGGEVTSLWLTDAYEQFWGFDVNGEPILGHARNHDLVDEDDNVLETVACEEMILNASTISDIIGDVRYTCNTLEMRLAQANYNSWAAYLRQYRDNVAQMSGVAAPQMPEVGAAAVGVRAEFISDEPKDANVMSGHAVVGDKQTKAMRLYEFVRGYADEYMGKKFLVRLPFILHKQDEETLQVTTSWEVTDGGYLPEDSQPLGLSPANADLLKTQDGRFKAFTLFATINGADLSKVSPQGTVIEDGSLYQEVQISPQIVYTPTPCVIATLSAPLTDEATDNVGDADIAAAMLQLDPAQAQEKMQQAPVSIKVAPATRSPYAFAVPLKSNILTYGPWYAAGAPGNVRVDFDPSLTPWDYGGYSAMNLAGNAKVLTAITNMQVSEAGSIELAGVPTGSLGSKLHVNGPNVTNIDVQIGPDGVTTSYRFQTYTPRFGVFTKGFAERLKRVSLAGMEYRKSLRAALRNRLYLLEALGNAQRANRSFMERQSPSMKRETPHDTLVAYSLWDEENEAVRQNVQSATMEEAVVLSNATNNEKFQQTAIMSMNGIFRPFSTNPDFDGHMAKLGEASLGGVIPSITHLNPWKAANDVEVYAWGNSYAGLHAFRRGADTENARALGLRAPLMLVGWGIDIDCECVPGSGSSWDADVLKRQDNWKVGPLDPLWDHRRGVWTVHTNKVGRVLGTITAGSQGTFEAEAGDGTTYQIQVENWSNKAITAGPGKRAMAVYVAEHNKYFVFEIDMAADCDSSSESCSNCALSAEDLGLHLADNYDSTKEQALKHNAGGCLAWIDLEPCEEDSSVSV